MPKPQHTKPPNKKNRTVSLMVNIIDHLVSKYGSLSAGITALTIKDMESQK